MIIKSAVLAVVLAIGASQAWAQPAWYYGGPMGPGIPPREIAAVVRSVGLTPVTPPARVGPNYVVHAIDRNGETMRVVIDAEFGDVVRIRALGPRMARPGPWNGWSRPHVADELGVRQWWSPAPPRPHRNVPVARAPIERDDAAPTPRPRVDPPVVMGAPTDPLDAPLPTAGAPAAPEPTLPPPPPRNTVRTGPSGPPPPLTALPAGEPRMTRPPGSVPQGSQVANPRTATPPGATPLPKPKPSAEQMAAKPTVTPPAESKPAAKPRVVLPGGPAAKDEKAADSTGTIPAPAAAAPTAPPQAAPVPAPAKSAPAATTSVPPMPPMQTLE